jgi:hypothetical protein
MVDEVNSPLRKLSITAGVIVIPIIGVGVLVGIYFLVSLAIALWGTLYDFWDFVLPYLPQR